MTLMLTRQIVLIHFLPHFQRSVFHFFFLERFFQAQENVTNLNSGLNMLLALTPSVDALHCADQHGGVLTAPLRMSVRYLLSGKHPP